MINDENPKCNDLSKQDVKKLADSNEKWFCITFPFNSFDKTEVLKTILIDVNIDQYYESDLGVNCKYYTSETFVSTFSDFKCFSAFHLTLPQAGGGGGLFAPPPHVFFLRLLFNR